METKDQIEALQEVADEIGGKFRKSYSGRCMYGRSCVGIVTDDPIACIEEAASKGIKGAKMDNMGLSSIVYWPDIESNDNGDDDDDDEDWDDEE